MLLSLLAIRGSEPAPPGEHGQGSSGRVRGREREKLQISTSDLSFVRAFFAMLDVRLTKAITTEEWMSPEEYQALLVDVRELREVMDGTVDE